LAQGRRRRTGRLGGNAGRALALVIVLDQLPLNMFRGSPAAFSSEQSAVALARRAVARGFDKGLAKDRLLFLYMPFMHSENPADQDLSVALFRDAGMDSHWAEHHRDIVRRFGRFPHRNAILGRRSTAGRTGLSGLGRGLHGLNRS
jgi:uncharacterized protein (DUF924 family)